MIDYLDLQFFADKDEKTEQPTAQKKKKSRDEGQVAKSQEIPTAIMFLAVFPLMKLFVPGMIRNIEGLFVYAFSYLPNASVVYDTYYTAELIAFVFSKILLILAPIFVIIMVLGLISNFLQVGWNPTLKPLKPKLSKLNPLSGIKRMFSMRSIIELIKSLLKVIVISFIFYAELKNRKTEVLALFDMEMLQAISYIGDVAVILAVKTGIFMIFIAALDYAYQRYSNNKKMKMTKQEVKDEHKNSEGDPHIKAKIKRKMMEVSMRRMMQEVPKADVIITNPTHFAVALKYDKSKAEAPYCIAKGADYVAKRIKDIARESGVEIVENKQLARALYNTVEVNQTIPEELFQAVAEILAFVYGLKNKSS